VLALGGGISYFLATVFNDPTFAGFYKVAALDAANRLRRHARVDALFAAGCAHRCERSPLSVAWDRARRRCGATRSGSSGFFDNHHTSCRPRLGA
jgi:hypothetical protein